MSPFNIQQLSPTAKLPQQSSAGAAGYDLSANDDIVVPSHGKAIIPTGIAISIPQQTYARIAPRSGLAAKHMIDVGAGVIDKDYRGEIKVILFNHADVPFQVSMGDRIAQLILEHISTPTPILVDSLDTTQRANAGFGSTGK